MLRESNDIEDFSHVGGKAGCAEGLFFLFAFKCERNDDAEARAVDEGFRMEFEQDVFGAFCSYVMIRAKDCFF